MVLSTHAFVGAAVANLFPNHPLIAFAGGFVSHFILDAIPHWHYSVRTLTHDSTDPMNGDMLINKHFPLDLVKIAADGLLGVGLAVLAFGVTTPYVFSATLVGAFAGMLPDALQFLYFKWRHEPLVTLQRFHLWIHSKRDLDHWRILGPTMQFAVGVLALWVVR